VVIPNVGRFLGRGEEEARTVEYNTVRLAVTALMVENGLAEIPNPSNPYDAFGTAQDDMDEFPDTTSEWTGTPGGKLKDPNGETYLPGDKPGYLLYSHDLTADDGVTGLVNTVSTNPMTYFYTCETNGEIRQFNSADLNVLTNPDIEEYTY